MKTKGLKFDAIGTNPPYQDSSHPEKKNTLWRKFLDLSVNELVKEGGHVGLIIPSSWMGSKKLMEEYFLPNNLLYINKDECKRHFKVGSTFSYFVMEKGEYKHSTTIVNKQINGKVVKSVLDLDDIVAGSMVPRDVSPICSDIVRKVLGGDFPSLGIINNTTHHCVHKDRWRMMPHKEFKYPVQNTPSKLYWFNTPHIHQGQEKILIPTTTYFRRMMISTHGTTQSFGYYLVPPDIDAEIALHNINNIVFDYINECFRYANWNDVQVLKALPKIPLDKKLSDEEIYEYFDLNKAEIQQITEAITWR